MLSWCFLPKLAWRNSNTQREFGSKNTQWRRKLPKCRTALLRLILLSNFIFGLNTLHWNHLEQGCAMWQKSIPMLKLTCDYEREGSRCVVAGGGWGGSALFQHWTAPIKSIEQAASSRQRGWGCLHPINVTLDVTLHGSSVSTESNHSVVEPAADSPAFCSHMLPEGEASLSANA